ncbi:MAG TPA: Hsp20/alpha crystallin family protein [Leptolyngbyaceae cyanobacterium M33_DOE_097]|uniref:Hsp20/alpha crystallin family protein n=1 Tax=Oscillatoriales cyanobacterium SpSt-418 TaxID=2282169 RepID=A0A7C3KCY4_9CYAN|nr:Hsp20/alpha crystallin family protein [Leptolyngbyaceae cyanobacterium M33_DOE_097]
MALIHWQPWQEIEVLRRQFDQLFDELTPVTTPAANQATWAPAVELATTENDVTVRVALPGIDAKDLDVQISRDTVAISGEYRQENKTESAQFFRSEFRYGNFRRVVKLPFAVQNDKAQADFSNGVLTLTLPRIEAERPKVVKLNLTSAAETTPAIAQHSEAETASTDSAPPAPDTGDVWTENT